MKKILSIVLSCIVLALAFPVAYGQQFDNQTNFDMSTNQTAAADSPEAVIGKSENLTITDLRYREGSNQITGTITNNSTNEQTSISIYAVLFDVDDSFLGIAQGSPLVDSLPPADNSPFSIDLLSGFGLYALPEEVESISHYTIYARGYEPFF
ncbi:MAG: FxLYD domain-containing protein [Thermoproteota archaeon]|nr:FxLYD domain-containing protein [Thermoproteota archaeon]